jgi:hypothetical protein
MKIRYRFKPLPQNQRLLFEYMLLDEMDAQAWYWITYMRLWRSEGIVCTQ